MENIYIKSEDKSTETSASTLPEEQTGWSFSFPSLTLVTSDEAIEATKQKLEEANKLMIELKFSDAADILAEAAESTSVNCGEDSAELAEVLFMYGKCLLYLANESLFGGAVEDAVKRAIAEAQDGDSEDDESDEESESEEDEEGEGEVKEEKEVKKEEGEEKEVKKEAEEGEEGSSDYEEGEGESEEEGSDEDLDISQLAWENLEVARVILTKKNSEQVLDDKYMRILAEIHLCLGELELDAGNPDSAVQEFDLGLGLRDLVKDPKFIAEGHYLVGIALCESNQDKALGHLDKALQLLSATDSEQDVIKELKERIEEIKTTLLEEPEIPEGELQLPEIVPTNAFGAPEKDRSALPVHNFGTVGGNKRKAEGPTDEDRNAKKRKEEQ